MPFVYGLALATAGVTTCSTTAESVTADIEAAVAGYNVGLQRVDVIGKANAGTTISGIVHRIITVTTFQAHSGGTGAAGITPAGRGTNPPTAKAVVESWTTGPAVTGTGRVNQALFGCGKAGPGGWVAQSPDSVIYVPGTGAPFPAIDLLNQCSESALTFEWSAEILEN